jgi:hypothetical protein
VVALGSIVGDSLRPGADLRPDAGWRITRVWRLDLAGRAGPDQPPVWTVFDVEVDEARLAEVAEALSTALMDHGGWYADLRSDAEIVIVFAGRHFRYGRGDTEGRAAAIRYGVSVGVPAHQLDWPE